MLIPPFLIYFPLCALIVILRNDSLQFPLSLFRGREVHSQKMAAPCAIGSDDQQQKKMSVDQLEVCSQPSVALRSPLSPPPLLVRIIGPRRGKELRNDSPSCRNKSS